MSDVKNDEILQATFRDRAGNLIDPVAVNGWVKIPDDTVVALVFTPTTAVGIWEAVFTPTQSGEHWWRVESTGAGIHAAEEKKFTVEEQRVNP